LLESGGILTREVVYDWERFWCPRGSSINLIDGGYLADPDAPYDSNVNPALRPFEEVAELPCLALLGEPGIGKTETMKAERAAIDAAVTAEGGRTLRPFCGLWTRRRPCLSRLSR
jgi:hypothetical protein